MVSPIYEGHSHSFDVGIAKILGISCAVVFNHIVYWLKINASKGKNIRDGKVWMYETQKEIAEFLEYMTLEEVKKSIVKLLDHGILIKGNYNANPFDKTAWYTTSDANIYKIKKIITKAPNGAIGNANPLHPQRYPAPCIYNEQEEQQEEQQQEHVDVVVSSISKEIYDCLKNIDILETDKIEITQRYEEMVVKNAIAYTEMNKNKIKTTYIAYLKMACSKGLKIEKITQHQIKPNEADEHQQEMNRKALKKIIKDHWNEEAIRCNVCDRVDHARIGNDKLYYKDLKFNELLSHYLGKLRK